jgi:hypothetical protein
LNNLISYKCFFSHLLVGTSLRFRATKCQFTLLMKTPQNLFKQFKTPSLKNEGHTLFLYTPQRSSNFSFYTTKVTRFFFSHLSTWGLETIYLQHLSATLLYLRERSTSRHKYLSIQNSSKPPSKIFKSPILRI